MRAPADAGDASALKPPLATAMPSAGTTPASTRVDGLVQLGGMLLLAVGCWRVLAPFFPAMMFAAAVASSSWPLFVHLRRRLGERQRLASLLACVLMVAAALGPVVLLMTALAEGAAWTLQLLADATANGLPPLPLWVQRLPLLGAPLAQGWADIGADPHQLKGLLSYAAVPAREAVVFTGRVLGNAAMQGLLTTLLLYFLYRHGDALARCLRQAAFRLGGRFALELLHTASASVSGVTFGVLGAGVAQGVVATLGFTLAGVPNAFFLGAITFVVSMVPIGPPIVWAGAAIWLFRQSHAGWAAFMVLYGMFGISTIDNVVKPMLISRANHLPFVITLMGVIGGVLSFGVTGVVLGPTIVALCLDLGGYWLRRRTGVDPSMQDEAVH